jgi:hypothetical protein
MAGAFDIKILWTVVKDTFNFFYNKANTKKAELIEAHEATNTAFIKTYDYLHNNNGTYVPKPELAEVWNHASAAVMKVDDDLGNLLYHKSRFWLHPDLYINLNREDEIIELNQIVNEMERFRIKLK